MEPARVRHNHTLVCNLKDYSACPAVTVCIPTYNGRTHLAECIASIRAQTFADFEVVVCDDCSSDGTFDLARELAGDDKRFRFVANPQRYGLVGNWNNSIQQARGEWIKFAFQDDILRPNCIEALLAACKKSRKPFAFCEREFIFDSTVSDDLRHWLMAHQARLRLDYQSAPVVEPEHAARIAYQSPAHNLAGEPTVTLIHQSMFKELGGFDAALVQLCDAEFWCRVMVNHGGVFVPQALASFRVHAKATTAFNLQQRMFRVGVLDALALRYRWAFHPHYRAMRKRQVTGKGSISQRVDCARAAAGAWKQARSGGDSHMEQWNAVKAYCPNLNLVASLGWGMEFLGSIKRKVFRNLVC